MTALKGSKFLWQTLLALATCVCSLGEMPAPAIHSDYDINLEEPGQSVYIEAAAPAAGGKLWLGLKLSQNRSIRRSRLWRLDDRGRKDTDIELRRPHQWSNAKSAAEASIIGLRVTASEIKVYVNYEKPAELWMLQVDAQGNLRNSQKIAPQPQDEPGCAECSYLDGARMRFSPDGSEAVILESEGRVSHLDRNDTLDWSVRLPWTDYTSLMTTEAVIDKDLFATAISVDESNEVENTKVARYSRDKLQQSVSLPGTNTGSSLHESFLQMFRFSSKERDELSVLQIDRTSLRVQNETSVPQMHNFAVLLEATADQTAILVSRKNAVEALGVAILEKTGRVKSYYVLDIPKLLPTNLSAGVMLMDNPFVAHGNRVYMASRFDHRVIAFRLPR